MKEIYLAMDANGKVFGYSDMPTLDRHGAWWYKQNAQYNAIDLEKLGIDVTAFPLTHETPIKIRAKWEVVND